MALTTNLQAYYKLDESSGNAADSSGNGYTLTNTSTVGYAAGLINNGADFGASNTTKYFSRADSLGITHQNVSFSVWVKVQTEPASGEVQGLVHVRTTGGGTNYIDWWVFYRNVAGTNKLMFARSRPGVGPDVIEYPITLGTTGWHHIVMTYDTANVIGYLDGTNVATVASSGVGTGGADLTWFGQGGATDYGTNGFAKVYMDEVGVWSRALSSTEVTELYNGGAGLQYPFTTTATFTPQIIII